jgi:hypothetical protein
MHKIQIYNKKALVKIVHGCHTSVNSYKQIIPKNETN